MKNKLNINNVFNKNDYKKAVVNAFENNVYYQWKVETLWKVSKNIKPKRVSISIFIDELDNDRWFREYKKPIVREVLHHVIRIQKASLSYPIILSPSGRVMDGIHRICKALLLNHSTITAIKLNELPPSDNLTS